MLPIATVADTSEDQANWILDEIITSSLRVDTTKKRIKLDLKVGILIIEKDRECRFFRGDNSDFHTDTKSVVDFASGALSSKRGPISIRSEFINAISVRTPKSIVSHKSSNASFTSQKSKPKSFHSRKTS